MIPIVTPAEMGDIDHAAPEPVDELIERAGAAVARSALDLLGGGYGRRVVVLVGPGNNGADGRSAARRLQRRGVRVVLHELGSLPHAIDRADLVIDAALGTGARPGFQGPRVAQGIPVLAVDLPSGLDGLTGSAGDGVLAADRTVTFAALKPGLVLEPGRSLSGEVEVADIGLDTSRARAWVVTDDDIRGLIPARPPTAHKWHSALRVVAGSRGMSGAARLVVRAAQRSGAGYVRLSSPGVDDDPLRPTEAVGAHLPDQGWAPIVLGDLARFQALAIGPGLGQNVDRDDLVRTVTDAPVPVIIDGDALTTIGIDAGSILGSRRHPTILTPHDGEATTLLGDAPGPDRFGAARRLSERTGAIVVLKGPTTVVAHPAGDVLVATSGDARLATAGTGDVLTGLIGGLLCAGVEPFSAGAAAAHLHGRLGAVGSLHGMVAGDLIDRLPDLFDRLFEE